MNLQQHGYNIYVDMIIGDHLTGCLKVTLIMKNPVGDTDRLTQHYHRYSFFSD